MKVMKGVPVDLYQYILVGVGLSDKWRPFIARFIIANIL